MIIYIFTLYSSDIAEIATTIFNQTVIVPKLSTRGLTLFPLLSDRHGACSPAPSSGRSHHHSASDIETYGPSTTGGALGTIDRRRRDEEAARRKAQMVSDNKGCFRVIV